MAEKKELYRCEHCAIIVEVFHAGGGKLTCCNTPMVLLKEGTTDAALEKHVPVIEKTADGFKVSVGAVEHPMTDEHLIEWIEIFDGEKQSVFHLSAGDKPVVEVKSNSDISKLVVREYCNLHGHWKNA